MSVFRIVLPNPCADERKDWFAFEKMRKALSRKAEREPANTAETRETGESEERDSEEVRSAVPSAPPRFQPARTVSVNRAKPGTVRLWTQQDFVVWERLQAEGSLYVSHEERDPPDFLPEYDWMREQMTSRLSSCELHYPWWAWHRPKIDLRQYHTYTHGPFGARQVRLELAVPTDLVLMFSDEAWLMVLNRWYLPSNEIEDQAWEEMLVDEGLDPLDQGLPTAFGMLVAESWEKMFDLESLCQGGIWSPRYVQAVFERLDLADVVAVTEFTSRSHRPG